MSTAFHSISLLSPAGNLILHIFDMGRARLSRCFERRRQLLPAVVGPTDYWPATPVVWLRQLPTVVHEYNPIEQLAIAAGNPSIILAAYVRNSPKNTCVSGAVLLYMREV